MALPHQMYPPKPLSPSAKLAEAITETAMTFTLDLPAGAILPDGPNVLTLVPEDSDEVDVEEAETVLYSSISGNTVTVAERGFDSTTAKAWPSGTRVTRLFTAQDLDALQKNLKHGFEGEQVEIGKDAFAVGSASVAIGRGAVAQNDNEGVLGTDSSDPNGPHKWKIPGTLEVGEGIKGAAVTFTVTVTPDVWVGSEPPYQKSVFVGGMTAGDNPVADVVLTGSFATDQARIEAWSHIYRITTFDNGITLYALKKPEVDLPIQLKVVR